MAPTRPLASVAFSTIGAKAHQKNKRRGGRHFAYRRNEEREQEEERRKKKEERKRRSKITPPLAAPRSVPPTILAPTGSPYVFVSKPALTSDDEHDRPPGVALDQAQLLFRNYNSLPRLFETHQFDYVSPRAFKFELPANGVPEVAFLGRSNVGKSSLVNALMRRNLCQTSKSPGRTQLPYYYGLFSKQLMGQDPANSLGYLVDLPGYGFGTAPKQVVEDWQAKTQDWLLNRQEAGVLKRLFLLVDSRREPSEIDSAVMQWTENAQIPFTICLTKSDRVGVPQVIRQVNEYCIRFATHETCQSPMVHVSSSSNKWGVNELLESIEAEFLEKEGEENEKYT
jgi:GTP-binding protein